MPLAPWESALLQTFGPAAGELLDAVRPLAARLPEPKVRLAELAEFITGDPAGAASLRTILDQPELALLLMRLAGISRYAYEVARRVPGVFWQVVEEGQHAQVWGRRTMGHELSRELAGCRDDETRQAVLARFKHRHWLRILLGEACGLLRFEAIVTEISDTTDVLAQAAVELACAKAATRGAVPPFTVLGMGKLGARELNYSSDIDLIFVYEPGEDRDASHAQARRIGEAVIRWLDGGDAERLFRVDMRLRPEGERGELALSLGETRDYYWSVGRPWERQAMLKARPIAGDLALGERLLVELRPWIFPRDPRWEDIEESRLMRRRIEERADLSDVKTGAGGIRDIEFLAQHFQLMHGGRMPELRHRATIPALRALADRGILPRADAVELESHLIALRTIEHRLQCWEDRQEHVVPADAAERTHLAYRCGFSGREALNLFDARLAAVRSRVRELAARHFLQRTPDQDAALALLIQGQADQRLAGRVLAGQGFKDLPAAVRHLQELAAEPFFILSRARTERALLAILPLILHQASTSPDPDRTLANLSRIVGAVGGRAVFYELLAQRPLVLQLFIDFAGWSDMLTELIERHPGLPDEVADALARPPPRPIVLHAEARALIRGIDEPGQPLGFLRARELAVVAARDLQQVAGADAPARLSLLAEVLVSALLTRAISDRAKSWGIPEEGGRPTRFCVIALGKLGGRELSYGSDCDVLFVSDPGGISPRNGREGDIFWERVAQDLCRTMQEAGLGEVDPRLRPWGDQGSLVTTRPALAEYWKNPREVWERMAYVRAAWLAGDPNLAEEALTLLRDRSLSAPRPDDWAAQVVSMRRRLEQSVAGQDNLKRGAGGYVDAEFIAQALVLGRPYAELPNPPATAACLRALAARGVLPEEAADELCAGLAVLRGIENRLRLADGKSVSALPTTPEQREQIARRCGFLGTADLDAALTAARTSLRSWFDRLIRT
jgi:[glutamine synthetase] adenylyltransferase / [glutamine synthetase]-adenylyl-L-tyrosine phosphorylase